MVADLFTLKETQFDPSDPLAGLSPASFDPTSINCRIKKCEIFFTKQL